MIPRRLILLGLPALSASCRRKLQSPYESLISTKTELQRKFEVNPQSTHVRALLNLEPQTLGEYQIYPSKAYPYADIYLDTDDWFLFRSKISLRLRRRRRADGTSYIIQLKTEMQRAHQARTEVEDDRLDYYEHAGRSVPAIMDALLTSSAPTTPGTPQLKDIRALVERWVHRRYLAPLAPFQELRHLFPGIQLRLRPKIRIASERTRARVQQRERHIAELSLDHCTGATWDHLGKLQTLGTLFEYELESKERASPEQRNTTLEHLAQQLKISAQARPKVQSKYQSFVLRTR